MRKLFALVAFSLILIGALLAAATPAAAQGEEVVVLEIKGPVTAAMVGYFERGIRAAEEREAEAVLIVLDTPGGEVGLMLEIVRLFRNAEIPVIVYIGPPGAQAASAGSVITMAAHASGMAPETTIGAAAVVGGAGEDLGETLSLKITEDLKATVRGLTERRGPEVVTLAESMISDAVAVNANEALAVGLIDVVAADRADLLAQLDGRDVVVRGESLTLQTADAVREPLPLTAVETVLMLLSNPAVLGLLVAIAVPAILIELQSPGGYVAGFIGVVSLALFLYGAGQLPLNWLGVALMAVAFVLLLLEVKTGTIALGILGALTLLGGLLVLFNSPSSPAFTRISIPSALAITLATAGLFLFIAAAAMRAQLLPATTGKEGLIGRVGEVRSALSPTGSVLVFGELWRAEANREIPAGSRVVVKSIDGFTLHVEPVEEA